MNVKYPSLKDWYKKKPVSHSWGFWAVLFSGYFFLGVAIAVFLLGYIK